MRKTMIALMFVIFTNAPLAWGQVNGTNSDPLIIDRAVGFKPVDKTLPATSGQEQAPPQEVMQPIPESAEAAEDIEARRSPRVWIRAEYLIWWVRSANFPTLATTGAISDPAPGALNSLNTTVLFGGNGMDFFDRSGGRFTGGMWFDDEHAFGLDAGYFFLGGRSINRAFTSPGNPPLAVPFFNTSSGQPDSSLVTYPGVMSGRIVVNAPTFLQGAEANLSAAWVQTERVRLEGLAGFRYLNLQEGLQLQQISQVDLAPQYIGLVPFNGNTIALSDLFETHNHFYGGQLGVHGEFTWKRITVDLLGKVALGVSNDVVSIRGTTNIDTQPATTANGGLLAVSSNSGQFTRNTFAVVPEVGVSLKFQLTDRLRVFAGYTFIYWSNVARPGDQVDTNVNPNLVPTSMTFGTPGGTTSPAFAFHTTNFFAHGVNLGLEFRY